jgi:hypothetical protein
MTLRTEPDTLSEQLGAALSGAASDPYDAIDAAALAGLRARLGESDELQRVAAQLVVDTALLAQAAEDAAEAFGRVGEDDGEEVAWDRLCLMDEVCAAAWWLGKPAVVAPWADRTTRVVRGFPEVWAPLAESASRLLVTSAPARNDPALALWRAVEVAIVPVTDALDDDVPELAMYDIRSSLGLGSVRVVRLSDYAARELHAASGLPPRPPWERLGAGPEWEVVLTWDGAGQTVILVATEGGAAPTFEREGKPVTPLQVFGGWQVAAEPGAWRVVVAGAQVAFSVEA